MSETTDDMDVGYWGDEDDTEIETLQQEVAELRALLDVVMKEAQYVRDGVINYTEWRHLTEQAKQLQECSSEHDKLEEK